MRNIFVINLVHSWSANNLTKDIKVNHECPCHFCHSLVVVTEVFTSVRELHYINVLIRRRLKLVHLPIPTIHAMRVIIQIKAFNFSSVIVIDTYSFKDALQNTAPIRSSVYFSADLAIKEDIE